jgi:hypothetical protein
MSPHDLNVKFDADVPQLKLLDPELLDYIQRRRIEDVSFLAGARIMTEGDASPAGRCASRRCRTAAGRSCPSSCRAT